MPSGNVRIEASHPGFRTTVYAKTPYDANRPVQYGIQLNVAAASETVEVTAPAPVIVSNSLFHGLGDQAEDSLQTNGQPMTDQQSNRVGKNKAQTTPQQVSANVFNLQKKVAGVLPVRVDVPRAGTSYRFARALVLGEETKLTFGYKTK